MENTLSAAARPRKPWLAGLLSVLLPGLGQLYSGRWKRGIALWLGNPVLLLTLAFAGLPRTFPGFTVWLCIGLLYYIWVVRDAVRLARSMTDYRLRPFNRWYLYLLLAILASFAAAPLVEAMLPVKSFYIPSASMEPTLRVSDYLLSDLTWWHDHVPSRGDLVIYASPEAPDVLVVKRVVAVAGEQFEMRSKVVFINGRALAGDWGIHDDPIVYPPDASGPGAQRDNSSPFVVPADTIFVLGDNRDYSYDSRFFGPIPTSLLRGRPLFLYWSADKSRIGTRLR